MFLEFGSLAPTTRRNGHPGNPQGEFGLMIEWDWRITRESQVLIGWNSEQHEIAAALELLKGSQVSGMAISAGPPEIAVAIGACVVASFVAQADDPQWTIFDRSRDAWIHARSGEIVEEFGKGA